MIRLENVSRVFHVGGERVHALDRVDLAVETGEYLSIMGPSGSGKSTLLNILGLLDRPDQGTYHIDGRDTTTLSDNRQAAIRRDRAELQVREGGQVGGDGIAEEDLAFFEELHDSDRSHRLGHGGDREDRVGGHGGAGGGIARAEGLEIRQMAAPGDGDDGAGKAGGGDFSLHGRLDAREAGGREPG